MTFKLLANTVFVKRLVLGLAWISSLDCLPPGG